MIQAECAVCGCIFDVAHDVRCPACRAVRVQESFKPRDPQRTFNAIKRLHTEKCPKANWVEVSPGRWINANVQKELRQKEAEAKALREEIAELQAEVDAEYKQCRIPKGEANQIYELKRMRKLIGKL